MKTLHTAYRVSDLVRSVDFYAKVGYRDIGRVAFGDVGPHRDPRRLRRACMEPDRSRGAFASLGRVAYRFGVECQKGVRRHPRSLADRFRLRHLHGTQQSTEHEVAP